MLSRVHSRPVLTTARNFRVTPVYIQPLTVYDYFQVSPLMLSAKEVGTDERPKTNVVRIQRSCDKVLQGCDIYIGRACSMGGGGGISPNQSGPTPLRSATKGVLPPRVPSTTNTS